MYKAIAGFSAALTDTLLSGDAWLPLTSEDYKILRDYLSDGDYTFLELRDGNAIEIVKLLNICGKLVLERGQELTDEKAFRCGASVSFALTMQGVKDSVCQMTSCED